MEKLSMHTALHIYNKYTCLKTPPLNTFSAFVCRYECVYEQVLTCLHTSPFNIKYACVRANTTWKTSFLVSWVSLSFSHCKRSFRNSIEFITQDLRWEEQPRALSCHSSERLHIQLPIRGQSNAFK